LPDHAGTAIGGRTRIAELPNTSGHALEPMRRGEKAANDQRCPCSRVPPIGAADAQRCAGFDVGASADGKREDE